METFPTIWFVVISILWIGYLFLEGFDLGVGMHMKFFAKGEKERRLLLNTVGPVWDGNEVWLLTAGGATFAAFPYWYASLFSALYIPFALVLLGLIFRAVAFEYRGKIDSNSWRNRWDWAICLGSAVSAFGIGAMLALTTTGLPLDSNGDRVGGAFAWFNVYALIGGFGVVFFCLAHAWIFLALKTGGEIRKRCRVAVKKYVFFMVIPLIVWVFVIQIRDGNIFSFLVASLAVVAVIFAWFMNSKAFEGWSFIGFGVFLGAGVSSIFMSVYPVVLPSTIDSAYDLTISNASSSEYTLKFMTVIALFGLPAVLVYQGWTYWVFRKRITVANIPDAKPVPVAIKRDK